MKALLKALTAGTLAVTVAACDPGTTDPTTDGGDTTDAGETPDEIEVTSKVVALSATGSDAFYGVAFASDGSFYAVGFSASGVDNAADRAMTVAKFTSAGELDTTFGTGGIATKNVTEGGRNGELARGIVVQSDGRIVIAGTIEADIAETGVAAADRDLALVRFDTDGSLDETFGADGVVTLDIAEGVEKDDAFKAAGLVWDLALAADDKLVLHGAERASGFETDGTTPRSDTDFLIVRLTKDGLFDTDFGDNGVFTLDIEQANASARGVGVLADGSIIGGGYANVPSIGTTQPVLYKVTPDGELDTTFANGGVFIQEILAGVAEIYAFGLQGTNIVTGGYGRRTANDSTDWLSLRLTSAGVLDTSWGDAGKVVIDAAGEGDNARDLVMLDADRALILGGGRLEASDTNAMFAVLGGNGVPDATFGENGRQLLDLGGPADMLWSGALSPDGKTVALAGVRGAGTEDLGPAWNDDAALVIVKLP